MIDLRDITLTYPDGEGTVTAVDRANLRIHPGSIAAITGPSGSGKSSLLAVAATLIRPDSGSVLINDLDASRLSPTETAALRRREIGIVFQQPNLLASLTALEQLELMSHLGGRAEGHTRRATAAKARSLLDAVGLGAKAHKRPGELSGGERQRVNIARAFMNDPSVLVVDEPTSALDQARGAAIIELVIHLTRSHDVATLLVTHDRSHLPAMDAVHTMLDGVLTCERAERVEVAASVAV